MFDMIVGVATLVSALASVIAVTHPIVAAARKRREEKRRQNDEQEKP